MSQVATTGGACCAWLLPTGQVHDGASQGKTAAPERTGGDTRAKARTRDASYESSRGEIQRMGSFEDTIGQVVKDCQATRRDGIIHHREGLDPLSSRASFPSSFCILPPIFLYTHDLEPSHKLILHRLLLLDRCCDALILPYELDERTNKKRYPGVLATWDIRCSNRRTGE